jgi:hypothetical protein
MRARTLLATVAATFVLGARASAQTDVDPTPDQLLTRAKLTYHAHLLPPFVVYTLERHERSDGVIDFADTYTLRLWCRTSDNSCLSRRVVNGRVRGPLENVFPRFNAAIDPGPPTADLFEPPPSAERTTASAARPTQTPAAANVATIGSIRVTTDYDFRARGVRRIGDTIELAVEPRRDPDRNRAQTMIVDAKTFELRQVVARDRLYFFGSATSYPETFTIDLQMLGGRPALKTIHGRTSEGFDSEVTYNYRDILFPATLPDWYFAPATYGAHVADAPES